MSRGTRTIILVVVMCVIAIALWWTRAPDDGYAPPASADSAHTAQIIERGRVLARLANCLACHTDRGGKPFAGGRAIPTSFGTFYSPNITPDAATGIGRWSERDFWRALHMGYSRDGSLLYPAFPYPNFTKITPDDAHAIWVYLKTIEPVSRRSPPHVLAFPYRYRPLLRVWRALYFRPGVFINDPAHDAEWNRGAYLVEAVSHCKLCHVPRNALGAPRSSSPSHGANVLGWYAPALDQPDEAGVQRWTIAGITGLLHDGRLMSGPDPQAATLGPMAEVVYESLQQAPRADIEAIATYLKALPVVAPAYRNEPLTAATAPILDRGRAVYKDRCARCHGDSGEGRLPAALALAGNRAVTMSSALNPIRVVLYGGYPPGTTGNPEPFGMPPFAQDLSDDNVADVLSFIRNSWGNRGSFVTADEVFRQRTGPLW